MTSAGTVALVEALTFGLGRLVAAAAAAGYRLCLLTADRSTYTHELSRLGPDQLDVLNVDTTDVPACAAALRALPGLAGLISSTDTWALPGAELAAQLGLPGPDPAAVRVLRDKGRVRARLYENGLSRGRAVPVDAANATDAVDGLPLPIVLKDSAGTSSRAVWLARTPAAVADALREAARTPLKGHLIAEPYFTGPLYSAETVTWGGRTRLLGVSSRQLSPEPLRREEAAAFPVAFPAPDHAELARWIGDVLDAAGHSRGFAHTEFVLTTGGPEVVEINPRIGGALVGEALCRSLGTNVYAAMVAMALGEQPALLTEPLGAGPGVAFVLVHPAHAGVLTGWNGLDRLADAPGSPEWYPTARKGDHIRYLTDQRGCTGILLAEGPTAELALHRALSVAGAITPLVSPPGSEVVSGCAGPRRHNHSRGS